MNWLRNLLDQISPQFDKGGKFERLAPVFEATETDIVPLIVNLFKILS